MNGGYIAVVEALRGTDEFGERLTDETGDAGDCPAMWARDAVLDLEGLFDLDIVLAAFTGVCGHRIGCT